jgi:hypothetical protein
MSTAVSSIQLRILRMSGGVPCTVCWPLCTQACLLTWVLHVLQVNKKLEEVLTSKNSIIRALQYDVAKVSGGHHGETRALLTRSPTSSVTGVTSPLLYPRALGACLCTWSLPSARYNRIQHHRVAAAPPLTMGKAQVQQQLQETRHAGKH